MWKLAIISALVGCSNGSDPIGPDAGISADAPAAVDPTGAWSMTFDFAADSCGHAATSLPKTWDVVRVGSSYSILVTGTATPQTVQPGASMLCTSDSCEAQLTLTWMSANGATSYTQPLDLTLAPNGVITGNGSESTTTSGVTCSATLTARGVR